MKATEFKRVQQLLSLESSANRCRIGRLSDLFDNFVLSPYFSEKNFKRGDALEVINQIECIQARDAAFNKRVEAVMSSAKVKRWITEHRDDVSGYAMGEEVVVMVTDGIATERVIIADRTRRYTGRGVKYNATAMYGLSKLICDVSTTRTRYTERVVKK